MNQAYKVIINLLYDNVEKAALACKDYTSTLLKTMEVLLTKQKGVKRHPIENAAVFHLDF